MIPGVPASACRAAGAASASAMTTTGEPVPPGKCASSTDWPTTESGLLVKVPELLMPSALRLNMPSASAPRASAVPAQTSRGRRAMPPPIRAQTPLSVGSAVPNPGLTGQKTQRPVIVSSAGSSVSMAARATAMPRAQTGPRPRVEFICEASRQSMLRATVPALARIAGPARCSASAMASCRSAWRRSSSR